ncbi:hypothetical protein A0H76_813 [Hepatospora eriocheir]|uniref:Uncharacterized protein n=1 Tax=Hepatospora eriocheir TaxID=1081669 RepID=A0A1X0QI69_9MICR|nr:hypothetical protein A0H76_813 [Hepatospora eriocheir]
MSNKQKRFQWLRTEILLFLGGVIIASTIAICFYWWRNENKELIQEVVTEEKNFKSDLEALQSYINVVIYDNIENEEFAKSYLKTSIKSILKCINTKKLIMAFNFFPVVDEDEKNNYDFYYYRINYLEKKIDDNNDNSGKLYNLFYNFSKRFVYTFYKKENFLKYEIPNKPSNFEDYLYLRLFLLKRVKYLYYTVSILFHFPDSGLGFFNSSHSRFSDLNAFLFELKNDNYFNDKIKNKEIGFLEYKNTDDYKYFIHDGDMFNKIFYRFYNIEEFEEFEKRYNELK